MMDKKKDMYSKGGSPMKPDMPYGKDYNKGGMPMVKKNGKEIPAFAADGIGKMNKGGMTAKSYNKGGYANCGASVKATQNSTKKSAK